MNSFPSSGAGGFSPGCFCLGPHVIFTYPGFFISLFIGSLYRRGGKGGGGG